MKKSQMALKTEPYAVKTATAKHSIKANTLQIARSCKNGCLLTNLLHFKQQFQMLNGTMYPKHYTVVKFETYRYYSSTLQDHITQLSALSTTTMDRKKFQDF